jgi:hypothetical protein
MWTTCASRIENDAIAIPWIDLTLAVRFEFVNPCLFQEKGFDILEGKQVNICRQKDLFQGFTR